MRASSVVLIAAVITVLALVFGLLIGAVIVPWLASWPAERAHGAMEQNTLSFAARPRHPIILSDSQP
jgi:hypothetical protein